MSSSIVVHSTLTQQKKTSFVAINCEVRNKKKTGRVRVTLKVDDKKSSMYLNRNLLLQDQTWIKLSSPVMGDCLKVITMDGRKNKTSFKRIPSSICTCAFNNM
jgi:hypothetical protein